MKGLFCFPFLWFTLYMVFSAEAVDMPRLVSNRVYSETIRSVKIYREGWPLSNPIIDLNSDQKLVLTFDDLVPEKSDYYYTIFHCTRDWKISPMSQQEYLPSFLDFPVSDFAYSVNTKVSYINYRVSLPNDDVPIRFSGNYALVIFNRSQPDQPVLIRRFFVVENRVTIDARIRKALFEQTTGENQEIGIRINHSGLTILDPFLDVKLVVVQNNRDDHAKTELKPKYVHVEMLEYDSDLENVFIGGNEFRYFEIRGIKYPGEGIADLRYISPLYHVTINEDELRVNKRYNFYKEMNGRYYTEAYGMEEPDIEADYMMVHFTLPMENVLMGGGVYVFGELSDWQCSPENRMRWNPERNRYELDLLLKQGYYNYMYAYMDDQDGIVKIQSLEGSHPDAENDYQVFLYHGRKTDRYDRLVGYQQFNSHLNRVFKNQ